jgi:hypothetical protein
MFDLQPQDFCVVVLIQTNRHLFQKNNFQYQQVLADNQTHQQDINLLFQ